LPGIFFFSFWVGKIQEKKSFANCYGIDWVAAVSSRGLSLPGERTDT
jgi:hypothetical protein